MGQGSVGRRVRAAAIAMALCAAGALPAVASAEPNYVALGDSYAAGPLTGPFVPPYGCLKSASNYPNIFALRTSLALRDVSCSGAQTKHMTTAQGVTPGPNPPQFDALDADTRLVTLHIGGNDIGFSGIAENCFSTSPTGSVCQGQYVVDGVDRVSARIQEAGTRVAAVLSGIKARAPQARVLVLNYPAIFPHEGGGCWPLLPVAEGDVPWLRAKQVELNEMLAAQAAAAGVVLVDAYAASRGKDACAPPLLRWVEPLIPMHAGAPVHPNLTGMLGMAELVRLKAAAPAPTPQSLVGTTTTLARTLLPR